MSFEDWENRLKPSLNGVVDIIVDRCKSNSVYYDIGANTGLLSKMVLEKRRDLIPVLFEPVTEYYNAIKENLHYGLDINFYAYNVALIDSERELQMSLDPANLGYNSLSEISDYGNKALVKGDSLYNMFVKHRFPLPHLIKIDVEESEYMVIEGAKKLLEYQAPEVIIIEVGINENHRLWQKEVEMFEYLFSLGYKRFDYLNKKSTYDAIFERG